jgi:hypothetical protein
MVSKHKMVIGGRLRDIRKRKKTSPKEKWRNELGCSAATCRASCDRRLLLAFARKVAQGGRERYLHLMTTTSACGQALISKSGASTKSDMHVGPGEEIDWQGKVVQKREGVWLPGEG